MACVLILHPRSAETSAENRANACVRPANRRRNPEFPAKCGTNWQFRFFPHAFAVRLCCCAKSFPRVNLACGLQDERFFVFESLVHRALPFCCLSLVSAGFACFFFAVCGFGGGGGGSAGSPASSRRYFNTFRLCSASVELKKCPLCVFATKYKKLVSAGCRAARSDASPGFPMGPGGSPECS